MDSGRIVINNRTVISSSHARELQRQLQREAEERLQQQEQARRHRELTDRETEQRRANRRARIQEQARIREERDARRQAERAAAAERERLRIRDEASHRWQRAHLAWGNPFTEDGSVSEEFVRRARSHELHDKMGQRHVIGHPDLGKNFAAPPTRRSRCSGRPHADSLTSRPAGSLMNAPPCTVCAARKYPGESLSCCGSVVAGG